MDGLAARRRRHIIEESAFRQRCRRKWRLTWVDECVARNCNCNLCFSLFIIHSTITFESECLYIWYELWNYRTHVLYRYVSFSSAQRKYRNNIANSKQRFKCPLGVGKVYVFSPIKKTNLAIKTRAHTIDDSAVAHFFFLSYRIFCFPVLCLVYVDHIAERSFIVKLSTICMPLGATSRKTTDTIP